MNMKTEPIVIKKEYTFRVRESKKSGQKTIGVPTDCNLKNGDEVQIMKIVK